MGINENFFVTKLMLANINEESSSNQAIVDAYTMAFPTPESRRATAIFPQQITLAGAWLEKIEARLTTLTNKPIEFIFGEKDFNHGTPEASHFVQEDSPENFSIALRKMLKNVI